MSLASVLKSFMLHMIVVGLVVRGRENTGLWYSESQIAIEFVHSYLAKTDNMATFFFSYIHAYILCVYGIKYLIEYLASYFGYLQYTQHCTSSWRINEGSIDHVVLCLQPVSSFRASPDWPQESGYLCLLYSSWIFPKGSLWCKWQSNVMLVVSPFVLQGTLVSKAAPRKQEARDSSAIRDVAIQI